MSILNEEEHIPLCQANVHYEAPYIPGLYNPPEGDKKYILRNVNHSHVSRE